MGNIVEWLSPFGVRNLTSEPRPKSDWECLSYAWSLTFLVPFLSGLVTFGKDLSKFTSGVHVQCEHGPSSSSCLSWDHIFSTCQRNGIDNDTTFQHAHDQ